MQRILDAIGGIKQHGSMCFRDKKDAVDIAKCCKDKCLVKYETLSIMLHHHCMTGDHLGHDLCTGTVPEAPPPRLRSYH